MGFLNMCATIRVMVEQDCSQLRQLIQDLAEYEKSPDGPTISIENLKEDGFGPHPYFKCFVAEKNGKLVGFSLFSYIYYTWVGKAIYLDDLYVKPEERGKGIGIKLMQSVMKDGLNINCARCTWHVLDWNQPSIKFYKNRGAVDLNKTEGKLL